MEAATNGATPRPIRVLLVDRFPVVTQGLCRYLENESHIEVVATARTYEQAIAALQSQRPDFVLVEPVLDRHSQPAHAKVEVGLQLIDHIRSAHPAVHVLVITAVQCSRLLRSAVKAGISGFLHKSDAFDELPQILVDLTRKGAQPYFSPAALALLSGDDEEPAAEKNLSSLTARELEVLRMVVSGRDSRQIAEEFGISVRTVNTHRSRILRKAKAHSFFELIDYAREIA